MSETPVKPGYATTEFWITLATVVAGLAVSQGWLKPDDIEKTAGYAQQAYEIIGIIAAGLAAAAYSVGRAVTKH